MASSAFHYEEATQAEYKPVRGLFESVGHFLSTLGSLAQARLELASAEVQEHIYRALNVLIRSIVVLFASSMGLLMGAIACILAASEDNRPRVAVALAAVFLILAAVLGWSIWRELHTQARLMRTTLDQFRKDTDALKVNEPWHDTST